MHPSKRSRLDRRDFLGLGALGAAGLAFGSLPRQASSFDDYRALVCVFLYGGIDSLNLLVPMESSAYATYANTRGVLAEPFESLLPVQSASAPSIPLGLHAQAGELASLFSAGRLAFLANVGPLVQPTTKAEILAGTAQLPKELGSHIDQQRGWQRAWASSVTPTGWMGRMLDHMSIEAGALPLPPSVAVDFADVTQVGATGGPYVVGSNGPGVSSVLSDPLRALAIQELLGDSISPLHSALAKTQSEAMEIGSELAALLATAPSFDGLFGDDPLARQLRMVARLIALRESIGLKRQAFFVSMGGWDTHEDQFTQLPILIGTLSRAVGAFQTALDQIQAADQVVTVTQSEFARTLTSNGEGSDHAWGGHAFAIGNPVLGGELYGTLPDLSSTGPDVADIGSVIPRLAVEQYDATAARWFGLDPSALPAVFPNLHRFDSDDLGFLA
ncbi:MAG: DUF1501 domain-containing protein [Planctomycetota bacterium]